MKKENVITKGKSFYEKWNSEEPGSINFGSFTTTLMQLYRIADGTNQQKLKKAYPEYFCLYAERFLFEGHERDTEDYIDHVYSNLSKYRIVFTDLSQRDYIMTTHEANTIKWQDGYNLIGSIYQMSYVISKEQRNELS